MNEKKGRDTIRVSNTQSKDRRTAKTKSALKKALYEIVKDYNEINSISVTALCEKADVNRSTFYFYYKDIYDMVEQLQNELYASFESYLVNKNYRFDKITDYIEYITNILYFCKENETDCKFMLDYDFNQNLQKKLLNTLYSQIPDSTAKFKEDDPRYYLTAFATNAIKGAIIQWLYDGMKVSPENMTRFLGMTYIFGAAKIKTDAVDSFFQ